MLVVFQVVLKSGEFGGVFDRDAARVTHEEKCLQVAAGGGEFHPADLREVDPLLIQK